MQQIKKPQDQDKTASLTGILKLDTNENVLDPLSFTPTTYSPPTAV